MNHTHTLHSPPFSDVVEMACGVLKRLLGAGSVTSEPPDVGANCLAGIDFSWPALTLTCAFEENELVLMYMKTKSGDDDKSDVTVSTHPYTTLTSIDNLVALIQEALVMCHAYLASKE